MLRFQLLGVMILAAAFSMLCARPALAHRNFFNATLESGSGSLGQLALSGQYGFSTDSPFFVYGEASHEVFYLAPDDNSYRALGEVGYESTHLGLSLRGGYFMGPFESLTFNQLGGTLFYRFVRWSLLTSEEELYLKREERKAIIERHKRETNEDLPKAPLLAISYDQYSLSSSFSALNTINPLRLSGWLSVTMEPFFTFMPSVAFYQYDVLPSTDPAGKVSYTSRALRLVRLGPHGQYSGIFGLPNNTQQLYAELKVVPLLQVDAALTRVSLDSPSFVGYSAWLGFDRFFSQDKRWAVSPSYEQYFLEGQTYSYFTISFRYGAASAYLPPFE